MRKEREMFREILEWLEKNYDDTNFDKLAEELPCMCSKYKGSGLWQNLVYAVLDHLEAKAKYERSKNESENRVEYRNRQVH